jgi:hypothetical protein
LLIEVGIMSIDNLTNVKMRNLKYDMVADELILTTKIKIEYSHMSLQWDGIVNKFHNSYVRI